MERRTNTKSMTSGPCVAAKLNDSAKPRENMGVVDEGRKREEREERERGARWEWR